MERTAAVVALEDQLWAEYLTALDGERPTAALVAIEFLHELRPRNTFYAYVRGKALRVVGRHTEAEQLLLEAHANFMGKDIYCVELALGDVYRDAGRPRQAEEWFRRALASAPDTTAPYVYLAGFLASQERFAEACAVLEGGMNAKGDPDEVQLNLALNRRALGDLDGARVAALKALQLSPDYEHARKTLTDIESAIGMRAVYQPRVANVAREE